ncbi:MAG: LysR family transcriptional regulator [Ruminococcaceae bacterium]|nr:LysR family transcriptional regulator [Oscillospiraceae bacterium]
MNISYDHYRVFYNVAKYKSFTRAAEVMYSNQPNLTRAIKTLERQLGCTLFERTNKGVRLTEDGKELYEHIAIAFEHIQAGEEAVSAKHSMDYGLVSIGATEIALRCCLLPILRGYHQLYPGIRIKLLNVSSPQALRMIENKLVDFAVVTTPADITGKLTATKLSLLQEVPVCSKSFPIKESVSFAELAEYPIISLGAGTSTFDFYSNEFLKRNCSFSPDIEAATADQILPLVKYGLGIGFVPEQFLETENDVCAVSLSEPLPTREIILARKKGHTLPLPAKELVDMINREYDIERS